MGARCLLVFAVLGFVLLVIGIVIKYAVMPPLINEKIKEATILENGTKQFERWEELPFALDFKVYIFNVENPEEVMDGLKPNLTERGPYVYKQQRKKQLVQLENGTLSYLQYYKITFNKKKSGVLSDGDEVTILNSPLNAIMQVLEAMPLGKNLLKTLNDNVDIIFGEYNQLVTKTTVKKLLLDGMEFCTDFRHLLCNTISLMSKSKTIRKANNALYFSLFEYKHNHHDGWYDIKDGHEDINDLGRIVGWEKKPRLNTWPGKTSTCNMINGTDTTIFPPFNTPGSSLDIFNTDICRSVRVYYKRKSSLHGINTFRYEVGPEMLEAQNENTTMCFCVKKTRDYFTQSNGCVKGGVMELYPCLDAHVLLSFPHLLWADKDYLSGVNGLSPDPEKHMTFLELEPLTGVPISGSKRVQFNMITRPVPNMDITGNLSPILFPMVWIDESAVLPNDLVEEINSTLFTPVFIANVLLIFLMVIGAIMGIAFTSLFIRNKRRNATV